MQRLRNHPYLALLPPLVALGIQWVFWSHIKPFVWFLFYPAVFIASWIGGLRWGALATFLCTGLVWAFFLPRVPTPGAFVSMAIFTAMGLAFSWSNQKLHEAEAQVRRNLDQSEDRYQGIFRNMTAGFARCRMVFQGDEPVDFRYLDVNPAFTTLTGLRDVEGRLVSDVIPGFREANGDLLGAYGRVARGGGPERFVSEVKTLGNWFTVSAYSPAPGEFIAIFDTITEQKEAEIALQELGQRLELATRSGGLGVWDWNLETGEMIWDDRMRELYGCPPGSGPDGVGAWEARLHPEDRDTAMADSRRALESGEPYHSEFRLLLPEGTVRHIAADGMVQLDAVGRPRRMIGLNRDVTEGRRLEAELLQAQKVESLGSLAGGVAHDMNNVLSAILSITSTLKLRYAQEAHLQRFTETLEQAAMRGRDLVKRLTNFVRKDLERAHPLELNALVRAEAVILRQTLRQKVALELRLESGPTWILGEPNALSSVLMNLCVNAVDAMPQGGTLTIGTHREGGQVGLVVRDTGEGMSAQTLARATEAFFTTKPVGKGTGLGLSMVKNIVRAHGGTLQITSAPGAGTRVSLMFPPVADPGAGSGPAGPEASERTRALRLLVVDDDPLVRHAFPSLLREMGHDVEAVEDGLIALERFRQGATYDLVMLDHNMPGVTGAQVLDRLKRANPEQPILVVTGFKDAELDAALARWPGTRVLLKPLSQAEVQVVLHSLGAARV